MESQGRTRQTPPPRQGGVQAPATPDRAQAPPREKRENKGRICTLNEAAGGGKFCKQDNDNRGCAKPCKNGHLHACDAIILSSGEACGRVDHNRMPHDEKKHGELKRF